VIANSDVIEHIYDIDDFFKKIPKLGPKLVFFFGTSANSTNPMVNRKLKKTQKEIEIKDRKHEWGHKDRDSLMAYLELRKKMIKDNFPDLGEKQIGRFARRTRGCIKEDIIKKVSDSIKNGTEIKELDHPTNTCDPMTGNWTEHLMNPYDLIKPLKKDFSWVTVKCGYYGISAKFVLNTGAKSLNLLIRVLPIRLGLFFAPVYCVYGRV